MNHLENLGFVTLHCQRPASLTNCPLGVIKVGFYFCLTKLQWRHVNMLHMFKCDEVNLIKGQPDGPADLCCLMF